jgi:hypothetical protein
MWAGRSSRSLTGTATSVSGDSSKLWVSSSATMFFVQLKMVLLEYSVNLKVIPIDFARVSSPSWFLMSSAILSQVSLASSVVGTW